MTTNEQLAAYRNTQEFLDSTSRVSGKDTAQTLLDTLKKARGVIMQCALVLEPQAPKAEAASSKPLSFDDNLKAERSPIFESLTTKPGWANELLFAINTAKKMGCSNFEIVVKEAEDKSGSQPDPRFPSLGILGYYAGIEDDWRRSASAACHHVTVYAVTIR